MQFRSNLILLLPLLVVIGRIEPTSSANILLYYGLAGHSHLSSIWPVYEELGNRGHNLTLLTLFPPRTSHPAIKVIHVPELFEMLSSLAGANADLIQNRFDGQTKIVAQGLQLGIMACSVVLSSPSTHALVHHSSFDLVIVDTLTNECAIGLAALQYKCPFMVNNALAGLMGNHDDFGISDEPSWIPDTETGTPVAGFLDRVLHTWYGVKWALYRGFVYYPALAQVFVDNLKTEAPDFLALLKRTSLVLMNSHPAHSYANSLPPMVIPIAGAGLQEHTNPLPAALEHIVSSRKAGFIYISFGTMVLIGKGRPELRSKFFNVLGSLPELTFIWKWDDGGTGELPSDAPANVHFEAWLPQQDLLAHPKIRGFITHGGMNSINEAVHHGVPMVVIPIFGDQDYNAHMTASKGLGLVMELTTFTEEDLRANIDQLLNNKTLKAQVKRASTIFKDRPMKAKDTAVWWIEYVLRHGDTSFMMPGKVNQSWYERRLMDVWGVVFGVCAAILALLAVTIWATWNLLGKTKTLRIGGTQNGSAAPVKNGHGRSNKLKQK